MTGVEVAAPFSERALVYRLDQERYESDFYNEYFVAPRAMITSKLVEWLTVRRVFATTLPPSSTLDAPYAIEGQVTALYGDLRDKAKTAGVFGMQVVCHRREQSGQAHRDGAHVQPSRCRCPIAAQTQSRRG